MMVLGYFISGFMSWDGFRPFFVTSGNREPLDARVAAASNEYFSDYPPPPPIPFRGGRGGG